MKNSTKIIIAVVIVAALGFLTFNENGLLKFFALRSELHDLNADIKNAEIKLDKLDAEIDSLQNSEKKIEEIAREKFRMHRAGEKVLKVEEN